LSSMWSSIPKRRDGVKKSEASFSQERLWFMEKLVQGTCAFNMLNGLLIRGDMDRDALERGIREIVKRHEVLRSNLIFSGGKVWQSVSPVPGRVVEFVDLSDLPEEDRVAEAKRMAVALAKKPYDLSKDVLFRTVLIKISHGEHLLAMLSHHSVFDGWSVRLFAAELSTIYSSFVEGKPSPLPALEIQYGDYSDWQRRRFEGGGYDAEWEYWEHRLGKDLPVLELETDRPRGSRQSYTGDMVTLIAPRELVVRLKQLGVRNGCTLYMTLLTAFYVYLYRYSGSEDMVVGCPVAGRQERVLEGLMGFFINTLPIRADISTNSTFTEFLGKVRKLCLDAYRNQGIPFDKVVEKLNPARDLSHSPVYQVLFQLRNYPTPEMSSPKIRLEPFEFGWVTSQVDLTIDLLEIKEGLRCELEFPSELFERSSAERMARNWLRLLEGIAEEPERKLSELPLMADEELKMRVVDRNRTRTDYPRDMCIHQRFEAKAAEAPDAVAITHDGVSVTYRELNEQANQLAHHLKALGMGKGDLVGVCLERSVEMVAAFLAVLKVGGAYVPLDPNSPQQRMLSIIGTLKDRMVVTSSKQEGRLPPSSTVLSLDRECNEIRKRPKDNLPNNAGAEDMAHVIHTSGSLGAPKGVCCSHRGVMRVAVNTNYVDLKPDDTVVHASSPVFDAATFELFGALLNGARILIVDKETLLAGEEFADLLRRERATVMFITTALFNLKAREAPRTFGSLKTLMFGGEAADPSSVRRVLAMGAPNRLLNMYGPTENTVFSTFFEVREVPDGSTSIPIGGNISNSTSYILDEELHPVPTGVKGEIYVSGDGVALGYVNQPELSRSAFLQNPFEPNSMMYRTGDLGKFLEDGNIEFLGRGDLQVKIRGFRVELDEVESALTSHPSVKAGAVVLKGGGAGQEKRLVAYILPIEGADVKPEEIRSHVQGLLPDYMVPSTYVMIDSLPLTPTGKVDRRSLPELPTASSQAEPAEKPGDTIEAKLALLWCHVLGVTHVGMDDNFFELGGHSLMSVRLFSLIEEKFSVRLPLTTIFRAPTVAMLAEEIRKARPVDSDSLVPLQASGTRPPLFLVHAQDGEVLNYGHLVHALGSDQPVYGLRAKGLHGGVELPETVEEMARSYVAEIREVQPHGPYHIAGFCSGSIIAFEMAQQLLGAGETMGLLGLIDNEAPSPSKWNSHRWGRSMLLRESLFFWLDILRYGKKRNAPESLELVSRAVLLERLWMAFFKVIPVFTVMLPGEARQLPKDWEAVIINQTRAMLLYRPKRYEGVITVFKREMQPLINSPDPTDGWQAYAGGGIVVVPTKGRGHFDMIKPPNVSATAEKLRERIDWHRGTSGGGT
jgi:amino acid adenylation domain-containing protein